MKPFNLQAALGAKIFTRDGRRARIICSDLNANVPLVVAIESRDGLQEEIFHYPESGRYLSDGNDHGLDLMHEAVERSGWIAIIPGVKTTGVYATQAKCIAACFRAFNPTLIDAMIITEIHWEE